MAEFTIADAIAKRIEIRDWIKSKKKLQAEELKAATAAAETIDEWVLGWFRQNGVKNAPAEGIGTAYRKTTYSIKMKDRGIFRDWIINSEMWDEADIKPNKSRAVDYLERNQRPPPGVEVDGRFTVGYLKVGEEEESEFDD